MIATAAGKVGGLTGAGKFGGLSATLRTVFVGAPRIQNATKRWRRRPAAILPKFAASHLADTSLLAYDYEAQTCEERGAGNLRRSPWADIIPTHVILTRRS